jgi:membrane-associated phospholipid phosphatase
MLIVGLSTTRIGQGWRRVLQVTVDWLPFTLVLIAYDKTRAVADAVGLPLQEGDIVRAEQWLCGGDVPTVWLQQHLLHPQHVYWYDAAVTLVYSTHFLATPAVGAWLWLRDRAAWLGFIWRVIVLSVLGLVTYVLFPEAPPWMAAQDGYLSAPVDRLSARGFVWLHLGNVQDALGHAQVAGANPVAAMPSLHVGFATLIAIFVGIRLRSRWRYTLALYPLAMGFTLVYTGEHYVLDLLAGAVYALSAHLAVTGWERRRAARRADAASHPPENPVVAGQSMQVGRSS